MRFRKLRIAWAVGWGLVAVLVVVFWVRSYWWGESYIKQVNQTLLGCSDLRGCIALKCFDATKRTDIDAGYAWGRASKQVLGDIPEPYFWFYARHMSYGTAIVLPMWFPIVTSVGIAVVPWLRWRFSLRTLLIATTLIAVALGLTVWAARN